MKDIYSRIALDKTRKAKERIRAIYDIKNQRVLYKIALKDENPAIRLEATKALKVDKYLNIIARYDEKIYIRIAAVERIFSMDLLYKIAMSNKYHFVVRRKAIECQKISGYLSEIIAHVSSRELHFAGLERLEKLREERQRRNKA